MRNKEYEKPQIRDLDALGVEGQWPLGSLDGSCTTGSGNGVNVCGNGSGTGPSNTCSNGPA